MKLLTSILLLSISAFTGVLNGGGGGLLPQDTISYYDLREIIIASRAELILFFNAQKGRTYKNGTLQSQEIKKLFDGTTTIFDVIKKNKIYVAGDQRLSCKDENGNVVDGSIVSPKPNSICISMAKIAEQVSLSNARPQVLALIAHEYSHLLGFNENEAEALQKQLLPLLELDSKDHVYERLYDAKNGFQMLRGAIINYTLYPSGSKNWDYYCQLSEQLQKYFDRVLATRSMKEFSLFDDIGRPRFKSLYLKANALLKGTCSKSSYYPYRNEIKTVYDNIFQSQNMISAQIYAQHFNDWAVDSKITFVRIQQLKDVESEIDDIQTYVELEYTRINALVRLYGEYHLY